MEKQSDKNGFSYTYSASETEELKRIREKYASKEESKMERLRRLDASVEKKAQTVALIFGVLGTLILGFGMSLVMSDFSAILGTYQSYAMPVGIGIGVVGLLLAILAYPLYNLITVKERKKIAPEILRLTEELMK